MRDHFLLEPDLIFLNHGSFGACPKEVLDAQWQWQLEIERNPVAFLGRRSAALLRQAREALGAVLGARADDLVFVPNTTTGVNIVAQSFPLQAGDEVLTTDLEYGAYDAAWHHVGCTRGAHYRRVAIPLPYERDAVVARLMAADPAHTAHLPEPHHLGHSADIARGRHLRGSTRTRHRHANRWRARPRANRRWTVATSRSANPSIGVFCILCRWWHWKPIDSVLRGPACDQLIDALEGFVTWTLDTVNPSWRTEGRRGRGRNGTSLFEWPRQLAWLLADVIERTPSAELRRRLLAPSMDQPDEVAMRMLAPFSSALAASAVIDAPRIDPRVLSVLDAIVDRVLEHGDFRRSRYNDGRLGGFDLPDLIKTLLFVAITGANGATRFANGQWSDLPQILPLLDKLVRHVTWNSYVATKFVKLCERAGADYPVDALADQVLAQLAADGLPTGWKETAVPAGQSLDWFRGMPTGNIPCLWRWQGSC